MAHDGMVQKVINRKSQVDSKNVSKVFPMMSQSCPNIVSKLSKNCFKVVGSVITFDLAEVAGIASMPVYITLGRGSKKSFFGPQTPL